MKKISKIIDYTLDSKFKESLYISLIDLAHHDINMYLCRNITWKLETELVDNCYNLIRRRLNRFKF